MGRLVSASAAERDLERQGRVPRSQPGGDVGGAGTVRAEFLRQHLLELEARSAGRPDPQVELHGVTVAGRLDLSELRLSSHLRLERCRFDSPVDLSGASLAGVRMTGSELPRLVAAELRVGSVVDLTGVVSGPVNLLGARVDGDVVLDEAFLTAEDRYALNLCRAQIEGSVLLRKFRGRGSLWMLDADVGHSLTFTGADLRCDNGWAIDAQSTRVGYAIFLGSSIGGPGGFSCHGGIRLLGVTVNGFVCVWDAEISSEPDSLAMLFSGMTVRESILLNRNLRVRGGGVWLSHVHVGGTVELNGADLAGAYEGLALNLRGAQIGGDLDLSDTDVRAGIGAREARVEGALKLGGSTFAPATAVDLTSLTSQRLGIDFATAPERLDLRHARVGLLDDRPSTWPQAVNLRDFRCEAFAADAPTSVRERLAWLQRDPAGYEPQRYEDLAALYAAGGMDESARLVRINRHTEARKAAPRTAQKLWRWLLYLTVGYGYRPWLAGVWLVGSWIAASLLFRALGGGSFIARADHPVPFSAAVYAADALLPIVDLGQESSWIAVHAAADVYWAVVALGWLLTTALISALTGLLSRT